MVLTTAVQRSQRAMHIFLFSLFVARELALDATKPVSEVLRSVHGAIGASLREARRFIAASPAIARCRHTDSTRVIKGVVLVHLFFSWFSTEDDYRSAAAHLSFLRSIWFYECREILVLVFP